MSAPLKLAAFAAGLAALFGVATLAGAAIDPERDDAPAPAHVAEGGHGGEAPTDAADAHGGTSTSAADAHGEQRATGHGDDHGAQSAADPVRGLSSAENGLRLVVETPELRRGVRERLAFRIVGADGATVRDFDLAHERRLHLIVVRRDLTGFQHLHPAMAADGTWSTDLTLPQAGSYRLFADFARDGEAATLASDLRVDGDADLLPLPAPTAHARSDGGDAVTLSDAAGHAHGDDDAAAAATAPQPARAGVEQTLRFAIERDGAPVELEPYLGADGHLVALREGDLAFLHVHPTGAGPAFATTFPTAGRYRLYLQYKVAGRVETVAFTREVTR
ncbi:hypothetical protein VSS74_10115 [Conexibacter stalactiti]|uniref:Secreted protein n=1 Tax=Conexibacter stalactiti TaxID=1940611 RepID=A0ABU4HN09_9ACTN|nr:hypothetical protein [Conexibacter stalactiti]MDW5594692.1 hypothetical protein [Conexibacter stalactiti]MEC5035334.1 hypothetical protein [Conexibacter stalactiti]